MKTSVLEAARNVSDWHVVLRSLPSALRDVYFEPEYAALYCFDPSTRAVLFTCREDDNVWVCVFLLRPIRGFGDPSLDCRWFDIETPYGYGGPLANTDDPDFLAAAQAEFGRWCLSQKVVTEFVRSHPLMRNQRWLDPQMDVVHDRDTLSVDLEKMTGALSFSSKVRNMIRRAERSGVRIQRYSARDHFARFIELYLRTMSRVGSKQYYRFTDNYFRQLSYLVERRGWLLAADVAGQWVAAAVFIRGTAWLHYHLSASDPSNRVPGAANHILYTAATMASAVGLERLHLGGGRTSASDDSLFKFKQRMATDSHPFYTGTRIHNPDAYANLREQWMERDPVLIAEYGGHSGGTVDGRTRGIETNRPWASRWHLGGRTEEGW